MAHNHDHSELQSYNVAFAIAVSINLGFTIIEAVYGILANSMSLVADAGHNLGDVLGLVLAWGANWLMMQKSPQRYSYGFKKTSILAALSNALLLVAASALIAYESINKLIILGEINEMTVIVVAMIGIIINGGTALLFMRGREKDLNIKGAFLHLAADALISVGVVLTGVAILLTNWVWLDPIVGLIIVVVILIGTWGLLRDSVDLILAAVPRGIDAEKVKAYLSQIKGVTEVHDLHIWGLSTREVALTAHLIMPEGVLSDEDHEKVNVDLCQQFSIGHVTLQVEKGLTHNPCGQANIC